MKRKILITGANGFTGKVLVKQIRNLFDDCELLGVDIQPGNSGSITVIKNALDNLDELNSIINSFNPNFIIHLAGVFTGYPFLDVIRNNVLSSSIIHESVRLTNENIFIISIGSAAEYGYVNVNKPIDEKYKCNPVNSNGLSKALSTKIAMNYYNAFKINTTVLRPFQLIGKGISSKLVPGAFYKEIINAINTDDKEIKVGNLNSIRDFIDVHDLANAIISLMLKPTGGEVFNVCSSQPVKISTLLQNMIERSGYDFKIEVDKSRLKKGSEVSTIYGSYKKLYEYCGWRPQKKLLDSINDMFI